jgi:hypothetical protein
MGLVAFFPRDEARGSGICAQTPFSNLFAQLNALSAETI